MRPWLHGDFLGTGYPQHDIDHSVLRTATSTTATPSYSLGYLDKRHKGLLPCLSNLVGFHSIHDFYDASTVTTAGGVRRPTFKFFSGLTVCVATVVTAGGY